MLDIDPYCCCLVAKSCLTLLTPWTIAHQASPFFTISRSLLKFMSTKSVVLSNHLIFCRPLLLLPSIFFRSGSFPMSRLFTSGGRNTGTSASASVLPMNIQGWFPLGLTGLLSLLSKGLSRVFSSTTVQKHRFLCTQPSLRVQLSHWNMTTGKTIAVTIWTFVAIDPCALQ